MPPVTIYSPPALDSFTPLAEHQSQTPASFYGAKPVLHYHCEGLRAVAPSHAASVLPIFRREATSTQPREAVDDENITETVDAFISSEWVPFYYLHYAISLSVSIVSLMLFFRHRNLTLFNPTKSIGLSIPYPAISLHAVQTSPDPTDTSKQVQGLYLQLELTDGEAGDDDDGEKGFDFIEVTLYPSAAFSPSTEEASATTTAPDTQTMFAAIATCSNLHPNPSSDADEDMDDDEADDRIIFEGSVGYEGISGLPGVQRGTVDGALPPPFPGSGGWITAENVGEYFDEEGNWIGGSNGNEEGLGEGAGRVRTRDEVEGEPRADRDAVNGNRESGQDGEEHKRPRAE